MAYTAEYKINKATATNSSPDIRRGGLPFFQGKLTQHQQKGGHEQGLNAISNQVMRVEKGRSSELSRTAPTPKEVSSPASKDGKVKQDLMYEIAGKCYGQTVAGDTCFDTDPEILSKTLRPFTQKEERLLSLIKLNASMMLGRALLAVDARDENVLWLIQKMMDREDVKFSEVREKIILVRNALDRMKFQGVTCADQTCNGHNTLAFVCPGETEIVHICDNFFETYDHKKGWKMRNTNAMQTTLVHEAGHLAGIRSPLVTGRGNEFYCSNRDSCYDACTVPDPMNNVDALAYLFQCIANQF